MKGIRRWALAVISACVLAAASIGYLWPLISASAGPLYGAILGLVGFSATIAIGAAAISGRLNAYADRTRSAAERISAGDVGPLFLQSLDRDLGPVGGALAKTAERLREKMDEYSFENARLEGILESMSDGVIAAGTNKRITLVNQSASRMLGEGVASLLGRSTEHLPEPIRESVEVVAEAGMTSPTASRFAVLDGGRIEVEITSLPLRDGKGADVGILVLLHDRSEQARVERLRKDFVANASHELRTPVTNIQMLADGLGTEIGATHVSERALGFLGRLSAETQRLSKLTVDLLDLSLIEDGAASVPTPVGLAELCRATIAELEPLSTARSARVDLFIGDSGEELRVYADERFLSAAIRNLLENSLRHGKERGHVTVSVASFAETAVLTVADDGPGIALPDQERIFERFYRVDRARSRDTGGTGLGLSIVRNSVDAAGGSITVESSPDSGTVFTLSLPVLRG